MSELTLAEITYCKDCKNYQVDDKGHPTCKDNNITDPYDMSFCSRAIRMESVLYCPHCYKTFNEYPNYCPDCGFRLDGLQSKENEQESIDKIIRRFEWMAKDDREIIYILLSEDMRKDHEHIVKWLEELKLHRDAWVKVRDLIESLKVANYEDGSEYFQGVNDALTILDNAIKGINSTGASIKQNHKDNAPPEEDFRIVCQALVSITRMIGTDYGFIKALSIAKDYMEGIGQ